MSFLKLSVTLFSFLGGNQYSCAEDLLLTAGRAAAYLPSITSWHSAPADIHVGSVHLILCSVL